MIRRNMSAGAQLAVGVRQSNMWNTRMNVRDRLVDRYAPLLIASQGGYENVRVQILMGEDPLAIPMVTKAVARTVQIPRGQWKAGDGALVAGPIEKALTVPLDRLLHFDRQERP